jgi:uncharacterized protein YggE
MRLIGLILLLAGVAAAQGLEGVTITVTRPVNIGPDQAEFTAAFTVDLETNQQQVVQALQELGASNPTVGSVSASSNSYSYCPNEPQSSRLYFQVTFVTPPAAMKDMTKKLDALRVALPAGFTDLQFGALLTISQAALEAAHQSALPLLLADARVKAQALASAAGVRLGAIAGVTEYGYGVGYQGELLEYPRLQQWSRTSRRLNTHSPPL